MSTIVSAYVSTFASTIVSTFASTIVSATTDRPTNQRAWLLRMSISINQAHLLLTNQRLSFRPVGILWILNLQKEGNLRVSQHCSTLGDHTKCIVCLTVFIFFYFPCQVKCYAWPAGGQVVWKMSGGQLQNINLSYDSIRGISAIGKKSMLPCGAPMNPH